MAQAANNGCEARAINSMVFTKPVPNRMVQTGVRSGFYRGMVGPLPDPCLFRVTEAWWGHYQIPACSELRRHTQRSALKTDRL
nr:uncharacterized protein LOC117449548 isoform X3 [Pseudochaenichthys georgianus]